MDEEKIFFYLFVGVLGCAFITTICFFGYMWIDTAITPTHYLKDCIKSTAEKICLEEGMIYEGSQYNTLNDWSARCIPDRRRTGVEILVMFESEVERCRK